MLHSLQMKVRRVARREKQLLLLEALATTLSWMAMVAIVVGLLDYAIRSEDRGLRWLWTGLLAAAIGWSVLRRVWPVIRFRRSELATALRIERCFPQIEDRLSCAIDFLRVGESSPGHGGAALRSAVVERASREIERFPLQRCLSMRRPLRALVSSVAAAVLVATLVWSNPAAARLAATRLFKPWDGTHWPRQTYLELVDTPKYLGLGQDFEATVIDRQGALPDSVQMQYWFDGDDEELIQTHDMQFAGGRMVHRMNNVQRAFQYRAVGGDDDTMPWHTLRLVEPPAFEEAEFQIIPPEYTGLMPSVASGSMQALVGSRLEFTGRVDRSLQSAVLSLQPPEMFMPPRTSPTATAAISTDGLTLTLPAAAEAESQPLVIAASGAFRWILTDRQGRSFVLARSELRAVEDEAPQVRLTTLTPGGVATPDAVLDVQVHAQDDLLLRSITLLIREASGQQRTVPLWQREAEPAGHPSQLADVTRDQQRIETTWELRSLDLSPGDVLEVAAAALDDKPQTGQSSLQRLRIVSHDELQSRIGQLQADIIARLNEALRLQRELRGQVAASEIQLSQSGTVSQADVDRLQSSELQQRRIRQLLTHESDSLLSHVRGAIDELQMNRLQAGSVRERLAAIAQDLGDLETTLLPALQADLLAAIKLAPADLQRGQPIPTGQLEAVRRTSSCQQQVIERLEAMAERLAQWESQQRLLREADQFIRQQAELSNETAALQQQTLGRELFQLTPAQRAAVAQLARRQTDLSQRVDNFLRRLDAKRQALSQQDTGAAERMAEALALAGEIGLTGRMVASADSLQQNQLGTALTQQQENQSTLEQIAGILTQQTVDPQRRAAELQQAQQQLERIRQAQSELNAQHGAASELSDPEQKAAALDDVAAAQERLSQQTANLSRQAARLKSPAAQPLEDAAQQMGVAAETAQQSPDASRAAADQAQRSLEQAARALADQTQLAEQQELRQRLGELLAAIDQVQPLQLQISRDTLSVDEAARDDGQLDDQQQAAVQQLADRQAQIAEQTRQLVELVESSAIYRFQLNRIGDDMDAAARQLNRAQVGADTQRPQQSALQQLQQLRSVLESAAPPPPAGDQAQQTDAPPPSGADDNQQPPPKYVLEELRLAQLLQSDVLTQTEALDEVRRQQGELNEAQLAEAARLAEQQARLAEILATFLESEP